MELLFSSLLTNPERAITIVALFVALWLGKVLFNSFSTTITGIETSTSQWSNEVKEELKKYKKIIEDHSDFVNKTSQNISQEFYKIKDSVVDLKDHISNESSGMKNQINSFKSEMSLANQKMKFMSDALGEKNGKIVMIEQNVAKVLNDSNRNEAILGKVIKVVTQNANDIKKLKNK